LVLFEKLSALLTGNTGTRMARIRRILYDLSLVQKSLLSPLVHFKTDH